MKHIFLILLSTLSLTLSTQTPTNKVKVQWGESVKSGRGIFFNKVIEATDDHTTVLKGKMSMMNGKQKFIERYDKNLNQVKKVELDYDFDKIDLDHQFIYKFGDNIGLFSSFYDKKPSNLDLYYQKIDPNTLAQVSDPEMIIQLAGIEKVGLFNNFVMGSRKFRRHFSKDSTKMLISFEIPHKNGDGMSLGMRVFDQTMKELWGRDVELPYKTTLFDTEDIMIDNEGNVYFLNLVFQDRRRTEKRDGTPNYKYQVLIYENEGLDSKQIPISLSNQFITDMKIGMDNTGNIIAAGFYSDEGSYSIKGTYFTKIDPKTSQILGENKKEFGIDFITQNMTERAKKRTEKREAKGKAVEMFNYTLDDIYISESGMVYLVAEQYYVRVTVTTTTNANGGTTTTRTYTYYYNDIIVTKANGEGNIQWVEKIPKRQVTSNDNGRYSSYSFLEKQDNLYFIFNDHKDNLLYSGQGKLKAFSFQRKQSAAVLASLTPDGRYKKEFLFDLADTETFIIPKTAEQISKDQMIMFSKKGKHDKLFRMTFK